MRKTTIIASAVVAFMAVTVAACEKESTADTATQEAANPLIGHTWVSQFDTTTMGIHIYTEDRYTFVTDSTGLLYSGGESTYEAWWDTTYHFHYKFYPEVSGGEYCIDGFPIPTYFRYFPESQTLLLSGTTVFHLIEDK